jgi:hypothetical protein
MSRATAATLRSLGKSTNTSRTTTRSFGEVVNRSKATTRSFGEGRQQVQGNDPIVRRRSSTGPRQRPSRSERVVYPPGATIRSFGEGRLHPWSNDSIVRRGSSTGPRPTRSFGEGHLHPWSNDPIVRSGRQHLAVKTSPALIPWVAPPRAAALLEGRTRRPGSHRHPRTKSRYTTHTNCVPTQEVGPSLIS